MSLRTDVTFTQFIFLLIKVLVAAFLLKAVFLIGGFTGYVPVLDEVYYFFIKAVFSLGGNTNVLPSKL